VLVKQLEDGQAHRVGERAHRARIGELENLVWSRR
jgi:hypothetical protein